MSNKAKLQMIVEKESSQLWGRVSVNDNLIIDTATSLQALELQMRALLKEQEEIEVVEFDYVYDLTVFFEQFNFFNQSKIAALAGINPSLIRQYAAGIKYPSKDQVEKIEKALQELGRKMMHIQLTSRAMA